LQCAEAASLGGLFHFANVTCWQILLQKSFWGDDRKFLEPLMRFTRGDVRDHIVSSKIDHGPPWRRCKATQQQKGPKISFREIFRVGRFSTFATISAQSGHAAVPGGRCAVLRVVGNTDNLERAAL